MTPAEYLDAAKQRLCLSSDYELAKKLEIPSANIPGMRNGKRAIPPHLALSLAITLEMDPAEVMIDLEAQREKNEKRKELYRSFLSHARRTVTTVCMLVSILFAGLGSVPDEHGGGLSPA